MASPRRTGTDWATIGTLLLMYCLLAGNFLVYWTNPLPLAVHVLVSAVAIHLAFTIWHEAAHRNVSDRLGVNNAVGIAGMFPYMAPFFMQRAIHLQHHAWLNEKRDPNFIYTDGAFWTLPLRYVRGLFFVRDWVREDPRTPKQKLSDALFLAALPVLFAVAWWQGVLLDLVLLWVVPLGIAKIVMDWYINYVPHVGLPPDRFLGTRIIDLAWLTPLVLCHNYHAIHHLWPDVPWHRYRRMFREKLGYLTEKGVPIELRTSGFRSRPTPLPQQDALSS